VSDPNAAKRVEREARLRWVPIADMHVSPLAQRDMNNGRANQIANNFDLEQLGTPTVNERGGNFYIIDGQHRIEALRIIGWGDQQVQCWTYRGLTEQEEAEKFLKLNDTLAVNAFTKFKVGVQAGRLEESDIDRIVRAQGLRVSMDSSNGAISAVTALRRIYRGPGPRMLSKTLRIVRDAYGDAGLNAAVLSGIGLLCARYDDATLREDRAVEKLSTAHGGVYGLLNRAEQLRRQMGHSKQHCVAAAAVEIYNGGRGGVKLPAYWRDDEAMAEAVPLRPVGAS
jgi:hypothetical protein